MKFLIYQWKDYLHNDLYDICKHYGIAYDFFEWNFENKNVDEAFMNWFPTNVSLKGYSALVSINYFPLLAEVAHEAGVKYIAWCYDNPLNVRQIEDTLGYPTNYVFLFDKVQYSNYKNKGFDTVYHMPLGVNSRRLSRLQITDADYEKYHAEVAFVGNFYPSKIQELLALMTDYTKGYISALMDIQSKIYGYYVIDELFTDDLMQDIQTHILSLNPDTQLRVSKEALSFACASEITRKDRLILLSLLSSRYQTKLYSYEQNDLLKNVEHMGSLDYTRQMPKAFRCAKINLNPSLRIIQSGIPLRAFDIMGAGGFLLSNWQSELAELYVDGEDMVMYNSYEDAVAKADFYLKHEELRQQITASGCAKTLQEHSLDAVFGRICEVAGV
ncbi:MAG: glycosyltransferase [Lachnospiraceae bacterium]|nr:glycosyltransferase [Lachnospiraceae bacterium]